MRLQLSTNFHLDEFTRSQTAARFGIENIPPGAVLNNLRNLCARMLQPLHNDVGPMHISSGYRSPALNKKLAALPDHSTPRASPQILRPPVKPLTSSPPASTRVAATIN